MKNKMLLGSKCFYGVKISDYGMENGYVDYAALAGSFNHVMCNDIISKTYELGTWELENGSEEYYEDGNGDRYDYDEAQERIEELEEEQSDYEEDSEEWESIQEDIDCLNDPLYDEVFQFYIIDGNGADILKHWTDELVWYNEVLDLYVWGVTHYGTAWTHVLTDIRVKGFDD